ncbi:MAG: hypothetical protein M3P24_10320, partial [Gemmatimonadota bacterium]|nr:hypothetical protein [Gemmatimonadota bacterium]
MRKMHRFRYVLKGSTAAAVAAVFVAYPLPAQHSTDSVRNGLNEVFVGSEMEECLRFLQIGGAGGAYPWSIRSLSPREVERMLPADSAHPWAARYPLRPLRADTSRGLRTEWV